jgi:hypothetical protein
MSSTCADGTDPARFGDFTPNDQRQMDRPMSVKVKSPANVKSQRVLTLNTADSQEIYGLLQWFLIDIFPEYSAKLGPPKEKSK